MRVGVGVGVPTGLPDPPRVLVVGTTGSGKTTVARRLSSILSAPHVELDALHWEPNWVPASTEVFRERVAAALKQDRWICDGNYSKGRDLTLGRANAVVWLDYPLRTVLRQLVARTIARIVSREPLWAGNRESLRMALSHDSVVWWAVTTHARRKREYEALFEDPSYRDLAKIRLWSPGETRGWLAGLPGTIAYRSAHPEPVERRANP